MEFIDCTGVLDAKYSRYKSLLYNKQDIPHFLVFVGFPGSGRHTFVKQYLSKLLSCNVLEYEPGVEGVRDMIDTSYNILAKTIHLIPDMKKMSKAAFNALLKILEEPGDNHYYIAFCNNEYEMPKTIHSRAIFERFVYTYKDIEKFSKTVAMNSDWIPRICNTPGEVLLFRNIYWNIDEWVDYCQKVLDNIADVNICNALKISSKLALKDEEDKIPLEWFFRIVLKLMEQRTFTRQQTFNYGLGIVLDTYDSLAAVRTGVANKSFIFDGWLFDMREAMGVEE